MPDFFPLRPRFLLAHDKCVMGELVYLLQSFRFINGKNEACFHMKRNPRKLNWTLFYRRLRKKGTQVCKMILFPPLPFNAPRGLFWSGLQNGVLYPCVWCIACACFALLPAHEPALSRVHQFAHLDTESSLAEALNVGVLGCVSGGCAQEGQEEDCDLHCHVTWHRWSFH